MIRLNYDRAVERHGVLGMHVTAPEALPFAPSLHIRAFLLERAADNLLIYSTTTIEDRGGVARHYLNHRHEAAFAAEVDAPLYVHEADAQPGAKTFSTRHMVGDDFEVIPTPGHTPGATAYLWDNGEHRFLFTGDTIYLDDGEWVAAVLESSDRERYIESLELIRELDFDVLVPWAATAGQPFYVTTDKWDAQPRIDAILDRVRAGADR